MNQKDYPPGLDDLRRFPFIEALFGRRARRFARGMSIPDGPFTFLSRHEPMPLTELEQILVLSAAGGNTGWNYLIPHNPRYGSHLPNYAGSAGGRTFPSAAGFQTSELFFTDDTGVYCFRVRDVRVLTERKDEGVPDLETLLSVHRSRIRKIAGGRLHIPARTPYMEGHNTWVVNRPGSLLVIPVGDLAQHLIAGLCYYLQNGSCIYDDLHQEQIPGIGRFKHLCDVDRPLPLSFIEQLCLAELTAELSTACYAGMLMLQAMGLGGWMFDGLDPFVLLGASGDPDIPGLGFRYDTDNRWALPNPTGLSGIFEGYCPPHYPDMRAAVDAFAERKFEKEGPFHPATHGPWKESPRIRGSAEVHSEEFRECVALQAQYIYDRFGKFPGTVPSIFALTYLQAHHLDLEFYDHYYLPGAYLRTHAEHMGRWHPEEKDRTGSEVTKRSR
jgi:hypothetical protein